MDYFVTANSYFSFVLSTAIDPLCNKPHLTRQNFRFIIVAPSFVIVLTLVVHETPTEDAVFPRPIPVISSDPWRELLMRHGKW